MGSIADLSTLLSPALYASQLPFYYNPRNANPAEKLEINQTLLQEYYHEKNIFTINSPGANFYGLGCNYAVSSNLTSTSAFLAINPFNIFPLTNILPSSTSSFLSFYQVRLSSKSSKTNFLGLTLPGIYFPRSFCHFLFLIVSAQVCLLS